MADSKISALSEATSLATTDELVVATGGATKKATVATIQTATSEKAATDESVIVAAQVFA